MTSNCTVNAAAMPQRETALTLVGAISEIHGDILLELGAVITFLTGGNVDDPNYAEIGCFTDQLGVEVEKAKRIRELVRSIQEALGVK